MKSCQETDFTRDSPYEIMGLSGWEEDQLMWLNFHSMVRWIGISLTNRSFLFIDSGGLAACRIKQTLLDNQYSARPTDPCILCVYIEFTWKLWQLDTWYFAKPTNPCMHWLHENHGNFTSRIQPVVIDTSASRFTPGPGSSTSTSKSVLSSWSLCHVSQQHRSKCVRRRIEGFYLTSLVLVYKVDQMRLRLLIPRNVTSSSHQRQGLPPRYWHYTPFEHILVVTRNCWIQYNAVITSSVPTILGEPHKWVSLAEWVSKSLHPKTDAWRVATFHRRVR